MILRKKLVNNYMLNPKYTCVQNESFSVDTLKINPINLAYWNCFVCVWHPDLNSR